MNSSEIQLQASCFQWCWNNYPQTRRCMFHVPNGGYRNIIEAKQLKASGVVKGVWDLHFFWNGTYHIIEMKVGNNDLSDEQIDFGEAMAKQGAVLYPGVRSFEEFKSIIKSIIGYEAHPSR